MGGWGEHHHQNHTNPLPPPSLSEHSLFYIAHAMGSCEIHQAIKVLYDASRACI